MNKNLDKEIQELTREIMALKTEKQKKMEQLIVAEFPIAIEAEAKTQYRIKATPKNNVTPLISYYINASASSDIQASGFFEFQTDDDEGFYVILYFLPSVAGTYEIVFASTSELELELL